VAKALAWTGQAPIHHYSKHVIRPTLRDGTYFHSASWPIPGAVRRQVQHDYKDPCYTTRCLLPWTGGQPLDGASSTVAHRITQQLAAEASNALLVVTDEPEKLRIQLTRPGLGRASAARDDMEKLQKELRLSSKGVSRHLTIRPGAAGKTAARRENAASFLISSEVVIIPSRFARVVAIAASKSRLHVSGDCRYRVRPVKRSIDRYRCIRLLLPVRDFAQVS